MSRSASPLNDTDVSVIAPNLKRRLSGVTATIVRLVPLQARTISIAATGPGLPGDLPHISLWRLLVLRRRKLRVWHARRNVEMILGLGLRNILRLNLAMLFTSASQRHHTWLTRWLISRMDHVIATSQKTASYLQRAASVIHHGIDIDVFSPVADRSALRRELGLPAGTLIGCYGRIRHQKGTDAFVDALIKLLPEFPEHHAVVMGRATESHADFLQDLRQRVVTAGLEHRIHFLPEVSVDQMAKWYQVLDLFVAPQRWEGFGLTPLEAMACGVPTVATRVGAFEELIIPGKTGALIAPDDVSDMVNATREFLADPAMRVAAGAQARAHVQNNFTLQREADRITGLYETLLQDAVIAQSATRFSLASLLGWFPFQVDKLTSAASLAAGSATKDALMADVAGKTVAIVGNARALSKGQNGSEIDAADLVIRVNRAPRPSQVSHGLKTDWLGLATSLSYGQARQIRPTRVLWMSPKTKRMPYWVRRMHGYYLHPRSECANLGSQLGAAPTTGAMLIDLVRQSDARAVNLHGFDFFASKSLTGSRSAAAVPHDFGAEQQFVTELLASDGRFRLVRTDK